MKEIPGYEGYFCDEVGDVFSNRSGIMLRMKKKRARTGYETIMSSVGGKRFSFLVHRAVLSAFVGPSNGLHANHKNGVRHDNRIGNLEWVTRSENERHARAVLGKNLSGSAHPCSKLTADDVRALRERRRTGETYRSLAAGFGIGISQAARIANGKVWRHVN